MAPLMTLSEQLIHHLHAIHKRQNAPADEQTMEDTSWVSTPLRVKICCCRSQFRPSRLVISDTVIIFFFGFFGSGRYGGIWIAGQRRFTYASKSSFLNTNSLKEHPENFLPSGFNFSGMTSPSSTARCHCPKLRFLTFNCSRTSLSSTLPPNISIVITGSSDGFALCSTLLYRSEMDCLSSLVSGNPSKSGPLEAFKQSWRIRSHSSSSFSWPVRNLYR